MKKFIQYFTLLLLTPSASFAQDAAPTSESTLASFLPLIIIFVIFYFLLIRPQQKKSKEHQEMLTNLKIGNDVCTASGIFGKIKKIDNAEKITHLEIADKTTIIVLTASINQVLDGKKISKIAKKASEKTKKKPKTKKIS